MPELLSSGPTTGSSISPSRDEFKPRTRKPIRPVFPHGPRVANHSGLSPLDLSSAAPVRELWNRSVGVRSGRFTPSGVPWARSSRGSFYSLCYQTERNQLN